MSIFHSQCQSFGINITEEEPESRNITPTYETGITLRCRMKSRSRRKRIKRNSISNQMLEMSFNLSLNMTLIVDLSLFIKDLKSLSIGQHTITDHIHLKLTRKRRMNRESDLRHLTRRERDPKSESDPIHPQEKNVKSGNADMIHLMKISRGKEDEIEVLLSHLLVIVEVQRRDTVIRSQRSTKDIN